MIAPITHRRTFAALAADGKRVRSGAVRLTHLADAPFCAPGTTSVGFVFGRRFGNAVERNRARRRLRAALRLETASVSSAGSGGALLFGGSRSLLTAPFDQVRRDVASCLDRVGQGTTNRTPHT